SFLSVAPGQHHLLHSFPTRRSSDLSLQALFEKRFSHGLQFQASYTYSKSLDNASSFEEILNPTNFNATYGPSLFDARHRFVFNRSEEHTSELQSRGHLVCRLLLEKK